MPIDRCPDNRRGRPANPAGRTLLLAVWALGCTQPNPAFDPPGADAGQPDGQGPRDRPPDAALAGDGPGATGAPLAGDARPERDTPSPVDAAQPTDAADTAEPDPFALLPGMLGYWRFDDGSPSRNAADHSGNRRHGVLEVLDPTTAWTDGKWGGGLDFPGGSGAHAVSVSADSELDGLEHFTVAAWAYRTGFASDRHLAVFSRHIGSGPGDVFNLTFFEDRLAVYLRDANGTSGWLSLEPPALTPFETWIHVAATYDGATVRLYLDGQEIGTAPRSGSLGTSANPLLIGTNRNPGNNEPMLGRLDEVLLYDRALPPGSIAALAGGTRPPVP